MEMKRNLLWLLVFLGAFCALSLQPNAARAQQIGEQMGVKIYGPAPKPEPEAEAKTAAKPEAPASKKPAQAEPEDDEPEGPIGDGYGIFTLSGQPVNLRDMLRKGRAYLVAFWSSNSEVTRQVMPHLNQLADAYRNAGLQVIGLNIEDPNTQDRRVRAFLSQMRPTFPNLYGSSQACRALNGNQPCTTIPRMFVIAANGNVIARLAGYRPEPLGIAVSQASRTVNTPGRR